MLGTGEILVTAPLNTDILDQVMEGEQEPAQLRVELAAAEDHLFRDIKEGLYLFDAHLVPLGILCVPRFVVTAPDDREGRPVRHPVGHPGHPDMGIRTLGLVSLVDHPHKLLPRRNPFRAS